MSNIFSEILSDSIRLDYSMTDKKNHKKFVSTFLSQNGGSFSKKSVNTDDEVNQLISMLTSDSEDKSSFSANSTQTEALENRLRNMTQNGGAPPDAVKVKEACDLLKNAGYSFSIKGQDCNQYIMSNTSTNFMDQISNIFTSKVAHKNEPTTTTSSEVRSLFLPIGSSGNSETKLKDSTTSSSKVPERSILSTTSVKPNTSISEIPKRRKNHLSPAHAKGPHSLLDVATGFASGVVKKITNTIGLTQESGVSSSLESSSSNASKLLSNPSITSSSNMRTSKIESSSSPATVEQQLKGGGKKSKKNSKKNGSRKNRK